MPIVSAMRFCDGVRAEVQPSLAAHGSGHIHHLFSLVWGTYLFTISCHVLETLWYNLHSKGNDDILAT